MSHERRRSLATNSRVNETIRYLVPVTVTLARLQNGLSHNREYGVFQAE
jgi:hypothetical protein